jgi:hypothetical protein
LLKLLLFELNELEQLFLFGLLYGILFIFFVNIFLLLFLISLGIDDLDAILVLRQKTFLLSLLL